MYSKEVDRIINETRAYKNASNGDTDRLIALRQMDKIIKKRK